MAMGIAVYFDGRRFEAARGVQGPHVPLAGSGKRSLRIMEHDSSCIIDQDAQRRPRGRAGHNVLLRKWPKCIKLGLATFLSGTDQGLQGCFKAPVAIPVEGKDS